jgi:hypothetical protein
MSAITMAGIGSDFGICGAKSTATTETAAASATPVIASRCLAGCKLRDARAEIEPSIERPWGAFHTRELIADVEKPNAIFQMRIQRLSQASAQTPAMGKRLATNRNVIYLRLASIQSRLPIAPSEISPTSSKK